MPTAEPAPTSHPELDRLIGVMEVLRAPGGCAWDAEQTHASLVRYLVEECFELVEAIEHGTRADLLEELGDVLYQVLFHADIAAHDGAEAFGIEDVARHMREKMVGDAEARTADEVTARWDDLKKVEKPARTSVLDGVPMAMPALALADKVLGKAEGVGVVVTPDAVPGTEAELGAQLLALVAGARAQGLDPERALRGAIRALGDDVRALELGAGAISGPRRDASPTGRPGRSPSGNG